MAAGAGAGRGLVLLLAALAGTSGKAPVECPATCYKKTCDHWVDELGHSCEMLEKTDMCDCSGCWCGQPGGERGVDRGGHGARAEAEQFLERLEASLDITSTKSKRNVSFSSSAPASTTGARTTTTTPSTSGTSTSPSTTRSSTSVSTVTSTVSSKSATSTRTATPAASTTSTSTSRSTTSTTPRAASVSSSSTVSATASISAAPAASPSSKAPTTPASTKTATPAASTTSTSTSTSPTPTTPRAVSVSSSSTASATASISAAPAASPSSKAPTTPASSRTSAKPTTAPRDPGGAFDCLKGVRYWQDGWSDDKKDWCCVHEGLGCAQDSSRSLDCLHGLRNWTVGWTTAKQAECCDLEGLGCQTISTASKQGVAEFDCYVHVKDRATFWSGSKRSWCCRNEGIGCPPTWDFDCIADIQSWRLVWSGPKKQWCCRAQGLGCQPTLEKYSEYSDALAANATSDPALLEAIGDSDHKESLVELPAWWLLLGIVPGGGEGRFSEAQRRAFGVNRDGEQLDTERFTLAAQTAYSALCTGLPGGPDDPSPWWYLFGVQPASYTKREGRYQNVTFSRQQREHFGVDAGGAAADEGRWSAALEALKAAHSGRGELPDWWILGGVTPAGGGAARPLFSRAQQRQFGVAGDGEVQDQGRFDSAMRSILAPAASGPASGGAVPWWLAAGVQPASFERAGGAFSGVAFSREQQEAFGVDVEGAPKNRSLFKAVARVISEAAAKGAAALPPWWALQGVTPRGWIKRVGRPPAPIFSEAQEAYFGVDQRGSVVDSGRFLAVTAKGRAPPAWWILMGVQPKRADTNGTKAAFSHLQQERFGVDAAGRVVDHPRFDAATRALRASGVLGPDPHLERTPWWITNNVMPVSFRKDFGWYLQVTFSTRQQEEFGVGAGGEVSNAARHEFALGTLQKARAKGELLSDEDMLLAWQREVEMNSSSTTLLISSADPGAAGETAAGPAEAEAQDDTFALEMARLLRNDQRMRDDALERLGLTPASGDPVYPSVGGFDPSVLGVASADKGGGSGEPEAAAGVKGPKKEAGTEEESSAHARLLEKPTTHHAAVLEVACRSAADALKQSRQTSWITHVKVRCGELAQAQAAQNGCFLAGARAIAKADREVRWLAERGCRRTASSPRSPGLLGMLGTLANSTWERVLEIRNQSDSIYEEAVASAIGDADDVNLQVPPGTEVDHHGIEAVASLMCEDAIALDVTRAVQFKTAQLTRACTKLVEAGSNSSLGAKAASACLEAGFSALAAVGQDVSGCFADACRAFVAASGVRRLAVDTYEAVRRFKVVAGNSTLPAGCEAVAGASSDGLEGSIQVLMSAVLANATSRGSAVAGARAEEAQASSDKPRRVNDKFLVRGDAAVRPNRPTSAGTVAIAGLLVLLGVACVAALQFRSKTRRYHTVRAMASHMPLFE